MSFKQARDASVRAETGTNRSGRHTPQEGSNFPSLPLNPAQKNRIPEA